MTRTSRISQVVCLCVFHIVNRGILRQEIFHDDGDYSYFLEKIHSCQEKFNFVVYHWCLMPNHYHIVVELKQSPLISKIIGSIQQRYALYYHRKYHTAGKLFQNRFKSQAIQRDKYLIACGKYVELNPVRAKLVSNAWDWHWSSARFYVTGQNDSMTSFDSYGNISIGQTYQEWLKEASDAKIQNLFSSSAIFIGDKDFKNELVVSKGRLQPKRQGRRKLKLGISKAILSQIKEMICEYKPVEKIVLFGSRAIGDFTKTSDIDIAVFASKWESADINIVTNMLNEKVKTLLKFDVVHFESVIKETLKAKIEKEGVVIYDSRRQA